jgi:hypothetical protein
VKSFVVLKPGGEATAQDLLAFCRENLAAYKVPRAIEFRSELPRSGALKVLRRKLVEEELAKTTAGAGGEDTAAEPRQAPRASLRRARIPTWLKVGYTAFVAVLVPYYWRTYGPVNFLWFCDIALLVTVVALWLESPFLFGMEAVAITLPQLLWVVDFTAGLAGVHLLGVAAYMFDPKIHLFVRGLSSFHGWLPLLLVWAVWRLGYDRRALPAQTLFALVLLPVCYFLTPRPPAPATNPNAAVNLNWVFGPGENTVQTWLAPGWYLALQLAFWPLVIYLPTHWALSRLFKKPGSVRPPASWQGVRARDGGTGNDRTPGATRRRAGASVGPISPRHGWRRHIAEHVNHENPHGDGRRATTSLFTPRQLSALDVRPQRRSCQVRPSEARPPPRARRPGPPTLAASAEGSPGALGNSSS